ncbi:PA14 domain-containing protein [Clostridium cylindrosporum]|uniref:PA14 domain-containing protein n=1 Tax=Clostridium cylindrosporum DSM 605 TaxID=1121307 RepID=A0A0J8D608_CLOCY|nr:PA14 domain-containing protein [Clostridium cylindrosporum]KMT21292.1 hypothetical protein CLCY_2c00520 [Clostridium cylindrosporum DSM 605]
MKVVGKRLICLTLILQLLVVMLISHSNIEVKAADNKESIINIKVSDSTGLRREFNYTDSNPNDKFKNNPVILKGNAYANFTVNSNEYYKFEYKIVNSTKGNGNNIVKDDWNDKDLDDEVNENNGSSTTSTSWNEIKLNEQKDINTDDVMLDKKGYLKHKPYNVNHLPTITNQKDWNNRSVVYKNPYAGSSILSASKVDAKDYGKVEKYLEGGNTQTRFVNNSIFLNNTTNQKVYYTNSSKKYVTNNVTKYWSLVRDVYLGKDYKEASKIWGYIKVAQTGNYNFQSFADDGLYAYIMVNGEQKEIVPRSMFKVQGNTGYTYNSNLYLDSAKYYPIYIEYFNWGGDASFQMQMKNDNSYKSYAQIPSNWFYPSKTDTPGEYAESVFAGTGGVQMPTKPGRYYIAYKTYQKNNGNQTVIKTGIMGPFIVESIVKAKLGFSRTIMTSNNTEALLIDNKYRLKDKDFKIKYQISPIPIPAEELFENVSQAPNQYEVNITDPQLTVILPGGLSYGKPSENGAIDVEGGKKSINSLSIAKIQYELDKAKRVYNPITAPAIFIHSIRADNYGSYVLDSESSKITYKDTDGANREVKFDTQNILIEGSTSIIENGLYDVNKNKFIQANNKTKLIALVPVNFAVHFKANSATPKIKIESNASNYSFDLIKYELKGDGTLTKTGNVETRRENKLPIEIYKGNGFNIQNSKEYLVVYKLKPNKAPQSGGVLTIRLSDELGNSNSMGITTVNPPNLK